MTKFTKIIARAIKLRYVGTALRLPETGKQPIGQFIPYLHSSLRRTREYLAFDTRVASDMAW